MVRQDRMATRVWHGNKRAARPFDEAMGSIVRGSMMATCLLSIVSGCYSEASIRARAAVEMNCPADQLWVEPGLGPTRRVYGCNRTFDMVCGGTLRTEKNAFNALERRRVEALAGGNGCAPQNAKP
jgi:hypothetical protein